MTKITDEALQGINERFASGETMTAAEQRAALAHIAALAAESKALGALAVERGAQIDALTAERDALARFKAYTHQRMDEAGVPTHPDGEHSKAGCRIGDRFDVLVSERDEWKQAHDTRAANHERLGTLYRELCDERDALRERVKALETERDTAREAGIRQHKARLDAESRLAAIRQRAGDATESDVLAEFLPGVTVSAAQKVARYILGNDATAPHDALAMPSGAALEVPPGFRLTPEPTTAEAFAMVRELADEHVDDDEARCLITGNLSLLERRMGAQDAAARRLIRDAERPDSMPETTNENGERMVRVQWSLVEQLRAALTDAPPVFTLEDIRTGLAPWASHGLLVERVLERLTALRK